MTAAAVNHLYKSYAGKTADPGEILGLIGPNSAVLPQGTVVT